MTNAEMLRAMQNSYSGYSQIGMCHSAYSAPNHNLLSQVLNSNFDQPNQPPPPPPLKREKTMFQEITSDIKTFLIANRGYIYFIAGALLVDHFVFNGVFKARLQAMAEKIVGKIEEKIA